jgi:cytochrome c biogenesis protein CcdA
MKSRIFLIILATLLLLSGVSLAQQDTCVYFFYGEGCQHCARVEPFIDTLETRGGSTIYSFEVYNNRSNIALLNSFFDNYGIPNEKRGIPVVFIGNTYLIGDVPIKENLENNIKNNAGSACPILNGHNVTGTTGAISPTERLGALSLFTIVGAALVDSINPCAIAVLLILLGALVATGEKTRALKAGLAFTLSIYISYLLFGLGLFSALQISGLSYWFYKAIGILAIVIGLANIKDFFWYGGGGFVMEIPRSWRPLLKRMLSGVTSPLGAFAMGFVVCLFELPCTGGPYIVILGLLAERMTLLASIPLLLLYNVVFVLPLVVITLLIYLGFANVEKSTEWKDKNIRMLHLVAGIIMTVLGILIVAGLV